MTAVGETLCLLLVGHALGDFYSQSDKMAFEKEHSRAAMLRHCAFYAIGMAVAIAVLGYGLQCDLCAAVCVWVALCLAHAFVDFVVRPRLMAALPGSLRPFACDQVIHFVCCLVVALCIAPWCASGLSAYWGDSLVWATSLLLTGAPVCVLVKLVLGDLRRSAQEPSDTTVKPGELLNSGRVIGMLERVLVCTLALLGEFSAIAFVITAKSIARYEKMKEDKVFSEIYLVGTLASVASAIAVPLFVRWAVVL